MSFAEAIHLDIYLLPMTRSNGDSYRIDEATDGCINLGHRHPHAIGAITTISREK